MNTLIDMEEQMKIFREMLKKKVWNETDYHIWSNRRCIDIVNDFLKMKEVQDFEEYFRIATPPKTIRQWIYKTYQEMVVENEYDPDEIFTYVCFQTWLETIYNTKNDFNRKRLLL